MSPPPARLRRSRWRVAPPLVLSLVLSSVSSLALPLALALPALAQSESKEPAPEAAPEPSAVPVPEIPSRAEELESLLRDLSTEIESTDVEDRIEAELPELAELVEPQVVPLEEQLSGSPSLADLDAMRAQWTATEKTLRQRDQRLRSRSAEIEDEIRELSRLAEVWQRTRDAAVEEDVPQVLIDNVEAARTSLDAVRDGFETARNDVLILQSQLAELRGMVSDTLDRIEQTRERVVRNIFVRDEPALWHTPLVETGTTSLDESLAARARAARASLWEYVRVSPERISLHALLLVVVLVLILRSRDALARRLREAAAADPDAREREREVASHTFDRPFSQAIVLALIATPWLHPLAPAVLNDLAGIAALVPVVRVLRPLVGDALRPFLYALAVFFLADQLRDLVAGFEAMARWIFLAEMTLGAAGLAWLVRSARIERVPEEFRGSAFLRAVAFAVRGALVLLVLCAAGALLGYMSISLLVGGAVLSSAYLALALLAGVRIAEGVANAGFRGVTLQRIRMIGLHPDLFVQRARTLLRFGAGLAWVFALLGMLALRTPLFDALSRWLGAEIGWGAFRISPGDVLAFALAVWLSFWVARTILFLLEEEVYPRVSLPRGVPYALSTVGRYVIILIGFFVALRAIGFELDRLALVLGAFGVGIGFGLQNIVNNFVSGLILLFERPVQVGDRISLATVEGHIRRIGIRSSTVRTWDGAEVIVPNANLISDQVTNWTFSDRQRRLIVPVGVAYGTDPERVIEVLGAAVREIDDVLAHPKTEVVFTGFGDSSLDFEVRAWTNNAEDWVRVRSDIAVAVNRALADAGIEIPFPQRDVHMRSGPWEGQR